ncbi:MAG: alpha/beta hydrolase [Candidatus Lokiarchaeota archaeon]|nr:alpha/beta hydrolase [Candidatus Lokiarchaeota archaeon]
MDNHREKILISNTIKRFILIFIDVLFSWFIWQVNIWLGIPCNSVAFTRCFVLSVTTFLIVYTPFEIYWSIRDLWYDRWLGLSLNDIEEKEIKINVLKGFLAGTIINHKNKEKIKSRNSIIIVCHGFSDTKEALQYYYYPLAFQGYVILVYDARGTGKSKNTGKRGNFLKRIEDFNKVIEWVKSNRDYSTLRINCIGFSIGALTILCAGFQNMDIEKIIAISSMSCYKKNLPKFNLIVTLSYLMKGVKLFPTDEENKRLSPYLNIKNAKNNLSPEEWDRCSQRVMLIHSKNDRVIRFFNFKENSIALESPKENLLILKKGGHSQKKNECILVGATLNFLHSE